MLLVGSRKNGFLKRAWHYRSHSWEVRTAGEDLMRMCKGDQQICVSVTALLPLSKCSRNASIETGDLCKCILHPTMGNNILNSRAIESNLYKPFKHVLVDLFLLQMPRDKLVAEVAVVRDAHVRVDVVVWPPAEIWFKKRFVPEQREEVGGEVLRVIKVPGVNEGAGREDLGIVHAAHENRDCVQLQRIENLDSIYVTSIWNTIRKDDLLCDIVFAQGILEGDVKPVVLVDHFEARVLMKGVLMAHILVSSTRFWPTVANNVHPNELLEPEHIFHPAIEVVAVRHKPCNRGRKLSSPDPILRKKLSSGFPWLLAVHSHHLLRGEGPLPSLHQAVPRHNVRVLPKRHCPVNDPS